MKVLIVAGGTGGHLYPGIALAKALVGHEVSFVVRRGDLGNEILNRDGFAVREVTGAGLPRTLSLKLFIYPFQFIVGSIETLTLLISQKPDVIVGMGGYLSVPFILSGWVLGIRTLIHEQNVYPGLANRVLARIARSVAISFKDSEKYFPRSKTWVSGLPVRPEIGQVDQTTGRRAFGLDLTTTTYLVFGGSLGANRLNRLMPEVFKTLAQKHENFQVLHITGKAHVADVQALYQNSGFKSHVIAYCHDMASAYAAADLVICRSGASTVCELQVAKRRAVYIPYPHATNNHQWYNAQSAVNAGLARIVDESDLSVARVIEAIGALQGKSTSPTSDSSSGAAARLANYLTAQAL